MPAMVRTSGSSRGDHLRKAGHAAAQVVRDQVGQARAHPDFIRHVVRSVAQRLHRVDAEDGHGHRHGDQDAEAETQSGGNR
ncbi:hypothetical protein [Massilia phosphatilytica]